MSCSGVFQTGFQPRLLLFGSCLLCYCLPHPVVLCLTPLSRQLVAPSARQSVTLLVRQLVMSSVWWLVTFTTRQPATPLVWQSLAPGADNPVTLSYYLLRRCICVASYYIRYRPGVVEATNAPPFPLLSRSVFSPLFSFPAASLSFRFLLAFSFLPLLSHSVFSSLFLSCRFSLVPFFPLFLSLPLLSRSVFSRFFFPCRSSYPVSTPRSFPFFRLPPSTSSDHPYLRIPSPLSSPRRKIKTLVV